MEDLEDLDGDAEAEVDQDLEGDEDDNDDDDEQEGSASGSLSRTQSNSQQRLPKTNTQDSGLSTSNTAGSSNGMAGAGPTSHPNPQVLLTSPSPAKQPTPFSAMSSRPTIRPEALNASVYDIAPTIAAPHSTSINSITATPDLRWVFSGGADGYIRKFNWIDTVNGKVMLTVAQRHPFVDSVTKAGVLMSYWENEEPLGMIELGQS
jgi:transcriptional activator SPT8